MGFSQGRGRAVLAAFVAMLVLAALDQTILSTALPAIGAELHGQDMLSWVFSAYLMASTVAVPLYGRLGDAHGTRRPLLAATALFLLGSLACAAAGSIGQLIAARALQGAGGGGLLTLTLLGVAELAAPDRRPGYQGLLGATYGLSTLFGPLVGGVLVQHMSWHWAFLLNLPFAAIAFALLAWAMPAGHGRGAQRLDLPGAALLAGTLVSVLLATRREARLEGAAIGMVPLLALAGACGAAFVAWQRRAAHPILPLALFALPVFRAAAMLSAVAGVALFSAVVFLPTYLQSVLLKSPTASAWHLLPLMGGITLAALTTGRLLRAGRPPRTLGLAACLLMVAALLALATVFGAWPAQALALSACLLPLGVGIGMLFPLVTALAQRSAPPRHIGVATSTPVMIRSLGGAIGVAALGSLLAGGIAQQLGTPARGGMAHQRLADAFAAAIQPLYLWVAALCGLAAVLAWAALPRRTPPLQAPAQGAEAAGVANAGGAG